MVGSEQGWLGLGWERLGKVRRALDPEGLSSGFESSCCWPRSSQLLLRA